jgi:hypothetical protein
MMMCCHRMYASYADVDANAYEICMRRHRPCIYLHITKQSEQYHAPPLRCNNLKPTHKADAAKDCKHHPVPQSSSSPP